MWQSGARGSLSQITQMVGMKGLIASTSGQVIEFPIISSMKEGLTPVEYFISTHGSRKGLADTALNTAKAGYLTRRLFDVAQDAIIAEKKCKTKTGVWIRRGEPAGIDVPFVRNIKGRYLAADAVTSDGTIVAAKDAFLAKDVAEKVDAAGINEVYVFSPLTCETVRGLCQRCYGLDLGKNEIVELGEAVGTVAAQAIGEPATQLTMRTFHAGGTATVGGDITTGLPRVEEVFERRLPKNPAVIATVDGQVLEIREQGKEKMIVVLPKEGQKARTSKTVKKSNAKSETIEYLVHFRRTPLVKVGDAIKLGDLLTDGSVDVVELFKHAGRERTQDYIIHETSRIYEMQGASVSRKHIEVIVRQMFSRVRIKQHAGESHLVAGDIVEQSQWAEENDRLRSLGLDELKVDALVMGISEVSLTRESFLSSASFQHTTKTLIKNAIRGSVDHLLGLKENVIIGRLIPAGTGFPGSAKAEIVRDARRKRDAERRREPSMLEE
jgi:DNA-directed RNA polymerase subunit beta'